jgi:hypothetical protein
MRLSVAVSLALFCSGLRAQVPAPPEPPPSYIVAPIHVDLAPLMAAAEQNTPRVPPGVETWINLPGMAMGNPAYRFNLYRDQLYFSLNGRRLALHTVVNYWMEVGLRMKGWVKGMASCGLAPESFRRARLGINAEVGLTPDWGLDLKLAAEEPMRMDACQISVLGYDITDKVLAGMKDAMAKAAQSMEQQVKASNLLRQRAEAAWLQAQQPVELSHDLHLLLNPERVRIASWSSQGKELTITPEILVHPAIILGPCPVPVVRPLPPLDLSDAPVQPGFQLRVDMDLPVVEASRQLALGMVGQHFETPKGKFDITQASLYVKAPLVYLELGLKGRVNGTVTLVGRPVFDPVSGQLQLADLDYTLESKSWITSFGEWLYRSDLRKTLRDKCSFFMDKSFKDLRAQASQGLNRSLGPQLAMTGSVDDLRLQEVELLPDRFRVVAQLLGQVQISLKTAL